MFKLDIEKAEEPEIKLRKSIGSQKKQESFRKKSSSTSPTDVQLVLEKAEEQEIKLPTSAGSWKKQESSRKNINFCFIDYANAFDCVDHNKLQKILKELEEQTT